MFVAWCATVGWQTAAAGGQKAAAGIQPSAHGLRYAFVNIANASGLVAKDMQDYVALATDQERQQAALKDLDIDALYEDKACIQALDDFLRSL